MIYFIIAAYLVLTLVFLLNNVKVQCICAILGTLLSSFLAYWHLGEDDIATIIYIVLGLVCAFFFWVVDESVVKTTKNKYVAAVLALFFGVFGIHRFYVKRSASGLLYLLFCWTNIPFYLGIIECLYFLILPKEIFHAHYNVAKQKSVSSANSPANPVTKPEPAKKPAAQAANHVGFTPASHDNPEENDGIVNFGNIQSPAGLAKAKGNIQDFVVSVYRNNKRYEFHVVDGQMIAYKSPKMREKQHYQGVG